MTSPSSQPILPPLPKKRLLIAGILLVVLIAVVGAWAFHIITRRPVTQVIPIPLAPPGLAAPTGRFEGNLVTGVDQVAEPELRFTPEGKAMPSIDNVRGVNISEDGTRVYAADPSAGTVSIFERGGKPLKLLGAEGPGKLKGPTAVAEAPDGRIFVVDRLANRLAIFDGEGNFQDNFLPANMPPNFPLIPLSLAFDKEGALYLGDGSGAVYVFDKGGNLVRRLAPPEGLFQAPWGVAVNAAGQVAVTDSSHQRAFVFRPDGTVQAVLGSQGGPGALSHPRGIAIDDRGWVFIADTFAHRVQIYNADGQFLSFFGQEGNLDGQFSYPDGVAIDNQGNLYVADRGNKRVQVWRY